MIIANDLKCIFVHIQKTGGSSIEQAIKTASKDFNLRIGKTRADRTKRHHTAREIREIIPTSTFESYLKFAVVRNPFDRMVSWYSMFFGPNCPSNVAAAYVHANCKDFEGFLKLGHENSSSIANRFIKNQYDYCFDENRQILVDEVLRFENLEQDFDNLCQKYSMTLHLQHKNRSKRNLDYRSYYNNNTKQLVLETFNKDISYWNYSF